MRTLSGQEIVRIWEVGLGQHPLDRALTILMSAFPEVARDTLITLSVGQRDSCLLTVREQTFGPRLVGLACCLSCQENLEFVLDIDDMQIAPTVKPAGVMQSLTINGSKLQFRLPNSLDLAAIVGSPDVVAARNLLVRRCVLQAIQDGVDVEVGTLPETTIAALAEQMDKHDPLAEIRLDLDCPACGHCWQILFDIVSFLWTEISVQAKRLLRDVHTIARVYGWREAEVLSMSTVRRQFYLEMVT